MSRRVLLSFFSVCAALPLAQGEPLKPAWDALPPETVAAVRLPNGSAYFEAIRDTRVGGHLLSEERIEGFWEMFARELDEDWVAFREELADVGLEPKDFPGMFRGETGGALVIEEADVPTESKAFALFWVEPGAELAPKVMEALLESFHEEEAEHPVVRVDFSLVGRDVVHLAVPQTVVGPEGDRIVSHNADVLLTREEGRILAAASLMNGPVSEEVEDRTPTEDEPSQEMLGVFARFLQEQETGEGGFSRDLFTTPGIHEVLPEGVSGFEFAMDSPRLVSTILSQVDDPEGRKILEALGVLDLGKISFRGTIDRTIARWGGLVSAATPRRGLLGAFFDQRELSPEPAPWVPAHVLDYSHFSLDLGQLFSRVSEMIQEIGGSGAEQGLEMAEMQVQGILQTDIASFLSSFGQRHTAVTFPSTPGSLDDPAEVDMSRVAMVWSPADRDLWQRVMQAIGMFAPMMGEMAQQAEEQGFSGWRIENEMFEGGVFLGQDHLVLGMGKGTLEEVFSALRNPPEGEDSLAGSAKFDDARRLLDLRPGIYTNFQDLGRQMAEGARVLTAVLEPGVVGNSDFPSPETVAQLSEILDPDVLQEAFGMAANQIFATQDGIVFAGASDLGRPE